jgi:alkyl hydroperoxide reductase subunit AhpC
MVCFCILSSGLYFCLSNGIRRSGGSLRRIQKLGVEIYSVSTDTHFTHKAWHDTSDTIGKITYPMLGDPTLAISRNFEVLIEEEGLALRGTFVVNPAGEIKVMEVHDNGLAVTQKNCCVKFRPHNTLQITQVKFALRNGHQAQKH